jgi:two-component system, chemotaxis family, response regulator WspR
MGILIVDDHEDNRLLLREILRQEGYSDVWGVALAEEAFRLLGLDGGSRMLPVDLILMDVGMPGIDGVEATRRIRSTEALSGVQVIMVTAHSEVDVLGEAFAAGAIDYVTKPFEPVALVARIRCALAYKREMDSRKQRERELIEMTRRLAATNEALQHLSSSDALTGLANRRRFDEFLEAEWRRTMRDGEWLSLVIVDIDHFKGYNDAFGHQAGDECLRRVAGALAESAHRPTDLAARYGGEEFALVLSETDPEGAAVVAETLRSRVEALSIPHLGNGCGSVVTVSLGVAGTVPNAESTPALLVAAADHALYRAKTDGRNRTCAADAAGRTAGTHGVWPA